MPNDDVSKKKETAILAMLEYAYVDFDRAMDAIILIASAAKRKTSIDMVGARAIMNEKEPEPGAEPEPGGNNE